MADLGPGTMPRGKYPESPAPAGSHALISRTPTPGGMLHANLGLPRPPPRNFQPPLPQQPPKQTQQRPPTKPKTPRAVTLWRHACLTTPVVKPSPLQPPSEQTATAPPHKTKNPSCRHSVAACVSDHSRGQALTPATALRTNGNSAQNHRHSGISAARRRIQNCEALQREGPPNSPKPTAPPNSPNNQKICHNPPMLFVILEIALALAIVGLIVFWIARPPK